MSPAAMISSTLRTIGAGRAGELLRRHRIGVGDRDQLRLWRRRDVAAVNLADATGPEQPETDHSFLPMFWNENSELTVV